MNGSIEEGDEEVDEQDGNETQRKRIMTFTMPTLHGGKSEPSTDGGVAEPGGEPPPATIRGSITQAVQRASASVAAFEKKTVARASDLMHPAAAKEAAEAQAVAEAEAEAKAEAARELEAQAAAEAAEAKAAKVQEASTIRGSLGQKAQALASGTIRRLSRAQSTAMDAEHRAATSLQALARKVATRRGAALKKLKEGMLPVRGSGGGSEGADGEEGAHTGFGAGWEEAEADGAELTQAQIRRKKEAAVATARGERGAEGGAQAAQGHEHREGEGSRWDHPVADWGDGGAVSGADDAVAAPAQCPVGVRQNIIEGVKRASATVVVAAKRVSTSAAVFSPSREAVEGAEGVEGQGGSEDGGGGGVEVDATAARRIAVADKAAREKDFFEQQRKASQQKREADKEQQASKEAAMTEEERAVVEAGREAVAEQEAAKAKAMKRGFGTYKKAVPRKGTGRGRGRGRGRKETGDSAKVEQKVRKISMRNMLL
jgi:hypothetical protein